MGKKNSLGVFQNKLERDLSLHVNYLLKCSHLFSLIFCIIMCFFFCLIALLPSSFSDCQKTY